MYEMHLDDLSRLEYAIEEFEQEKIITGKILFYGDSMFTRWSQQWDHRPMEQDITMADGSLAVVNHGFGSSTAEEQLYFYDRAVLPWKPRALVLRTFGNDIGFGYSPMEIFFLRLRLIEYARKDMPGIQFFLCSGRMTPAHGGKSTPLFMRQLNEMLKDYCDKHDDCTYFDETAMPELYDSPEHVGEPAHLLKEYYVEDMTHFNQRGYDIYRKHFLKLLAGLL